MRGCRREHEALHLSLMVQLWQANLFPLLPILRAAWASSRNVKAAAGEWSEGLLHPNARVVQQSSRAERQSSGNCWGKKKKRRKDSGNCHPQNARISSACSAELDLFSLKGYLLPTCSLHMPGACSGGAGGCCFMEQPNWSWQLLLLLMGSCLSSALI